MKKGKHNSAEDADMAKKQDVEGLMADENLEVSDEKLQGGETSEVKDIRDEQIKELSEKYLRLAAEYDNFRRRSQKEKESIYADSIVSVCAAWLPVIDNLERGAMAADSVESAEAVKIAEGVRLVILQAKEVMNSLGIKEVEALGNKFDPYTMEAVMHIEDKEYGENEVAQVLSKGYMRGDKVLRHAIVKVAN